MDKEKVIDALKDEANFAAAARVVERTTAVIEVEEFTPYPVPRRNMGERMDAYNMAVLNDPAVQTVKEKIGSELMSEAWSEDLTTAEGWGDLSARLPEANVVAVYGEKEYALVPGPAGNLRLGKCPPEETATVKELSEHVTSGPVKYRLAGIYLTPSGVDIDHPSNRVTINLKKRLSII